MKAQVQKWGNSLALRIPHVFAQELGIGSGSEVELSLESHKLVLSPLPSTPTLDDLLAMITSENRHDEINTGNPQGQEIG